jgi:hypothetical protein
MLLISCSKRLFVVYSVFLSMNSSQLVKSDYEKKCIDIINYVQFVTYIYTMKCTLGFKIDGPTISLGGVHHFDIHSNATI